MLLQMCSRHTWGWLAVILNWISGALGVETVCKLIVSELPRWYWKYSLTVAGFLTVQFYSWCFPITPYCHTEPGFSIFSASLNAKFKMDSPARNELIGPLSWNMGNKKLQFCAAHSPEGNPRSWKRLINTCNFRTPAIYLTLKLH